MSTRKQDQRELVDELRPFFQGQKIFDADNPPIAISNDGLTVLRTVFALKNIQERLASHFLAMGESDPDSDFVKLARDSGSHAIGQLLEALVNGGAHPLLDYWEGKKSHARSRIADGSKNKQIKRQAVGAACCMIKEGSRRRSAEGPIANAIVQSGVWKGIKGGAVKNWIDATTEVDREVLADEVAMMMKDEPRDQWCKLIPRYLAQVLANNFGVKELKLIG